MGCDPPFFTTRGVRPYSEIIVRDEPPCIFGTTLLGKGVTPHFEFILGKSYIWSK